MTDRDYFAAAALTGLLAAPTDKDRSWDYWARLSYEAADAMLASRGGVTKSMSKEKRADVPFKLVDAERDTLEHAAYMLTRDVANLCNGKVRADARRLVKELREMIARLS